MPRHRAPKRLSFSVIAALLLGMAAASAAVAALALTGNGGDDSTGPSADESPCAQTLDVVSASSFEPVLAALAGPLESGEDCVHVEVTVADRPRGSRTGCRSRCRRVDPRRHGWVGGADSIALRRAVGRRTGDGRGDKPDLHGHRRL